MFVLFVFWCPEKPVPEAPLAAGGAIAQSAGPPGSCVSPCAL